MGIIQAAARVAAARTNMATNTQCSELSRAARRPAPSPCPAAPERLSIRALTSSAETWAPARCRPRFRIAPITAAPRVLPSSRAKTLEAVAAPRRFHSTEACSKRTAV